MRLRDRKTMRLSDRNFLAGYREGGEKDRLLGRRDVR